MFNIYSYSIKIVKKVTVYTPYSSEICIGKTYDDIISSFKKAGFKNIDNDVIYDLEYSELDKLGCVESIAINDSVFKENQKFFDNANVVIKYHYFKKITVPFGNDDVTTMDTDSLISTLSNLDFINIQTQEKQDLDPDKSAFEFENEVIIDDYDYLDKLSSYPLDSKIVITTHRPYNKHSLKLPINMPNGLLFSDYNVSFTVDGIKSQINTDETNDLEYRSKEGEYTIKFVDDSQSSVEEEVIINLTSDTEISYTLNRHSDCITLNTNAYYKEEILSENETIIPVSHSYCKYKDYKEIQQKFVDAGFTNISTNILFDIICGWTDEGEVKDVTVNGETNFIQGNVVAKVSPIVITYHMKESDDPAVQAKNAEKEKDANYVSYSSNGKDTVKNGNAGAFAYKDYDINLYYIIDFDEGYVYDFFGKDSESSCSRAKIVSGDLVNGITVVYTDGIDSWTNYFHFGPYNESHILIKQYDNMSILAQI